MKWEEELKRPWSELEEDDKSRRKEMRHKYARDEYISEQSRKPPVRRFKTKFDSTKDKCKVEICNAITCKHNEDKNCVLPEVTLSPKAVCEMFKLDSLEQ